MREASSASLPQLLEVQVSLTWPICLALPRQAKQLVIKTAAITAYETRFDAALSVAEVLASELPNPSLLP